MAIITIMMMIITTGRVIIMAMIMTTCTLMCMWIRERSARIA